MDKIRSLIVIWIALALHFVFCCTGANADPSALVASGAGNGVKRAVLQGAPGTAGDNPSAATNVGDQVAVVPASQAACLKEGAPCNPLNDKCCDGYYCFGGLIPTCVRKP